MVFAAASSSSSSSDGERSTSVSNASFDCGTVYPVRLLQLHEDLFAVHVNRAWRFDPKSNLVSAYLKNGHDDLVPDHDALIRTPREHEHGVLPPWAGRAVVAGASIRCNGKTVCTSRATCGERGQLATASGARWPQPIVGTTTCAASSVRRLITIGPSTSTVV